MTANSLLNFTNVSSITFNYRGKKKSIQVLSARTFVIYTSTFYPQTMASKNNGKINLPKNSSMYSPNYVRQFSFYYKISQLTLEIVFLYSHHQKKSPLISCIIIIHNLILSFMNFSVSPQM